MKFLSKLFQLFAKGVAYFNGFGQVIQATDPKLGGVIQTVSKDLGQILDITTDVEKISAAATSPMTGEQKLEIAAPLVGDIIAGSAALTGHKIANIDLYNQGVKKMASGAADIVNSLSTDGIENSVLMVSKS